MKRKKVYEIVFLTVIITFFAVLLLLGLHGNYKIANEPVDYAIGKIIDYEVGARVAPWFDYVFYVQKREIMASHSIVDELRIEDNDSLRTYIGKKFFVKYNTENPKINRLMLGHPVWENLEQPDEGWDELPKE